jgi:outer membrane protein insertion porin family
MYKYLILFFLFINTNLSAEVVQNITVSGNDRISKETIRVYGEIELNKNYSTPEVNKILKNLYKTEFFEDVKISLANGVLNIIVKEYPVTNSIDLRPEKSTQIKKKILQLLSLQEKDSFIENKIAEDVNQIKKIYASMGFNFVNVEAKIEKFDDSRVNVVYFLEKGEKTNISKINFIGDKKIKEKRLRDIIVSEEKKFWKFLSRNTFLNSTNVELDKRLLINYYKSLGYYDVQVLSDKAEISKDNFTTLTYTINAGNRYRINKISTNVSDVLNKKIFSSLEKNFTEVIGKYYSPFIVTKLLNNLDDLIAKNDLQFIEHSVNEILEGESIEIKINVFEGKKILVEKINILGNQVTDESVIRSELLLDEGDPFNALKLDKTIAKLKARNLFGSVKPSIKTGSKNNQKIIDIEVEEKPTGEISAGAGIGTTGGSFAFSVVENNWLGKGVNVSTTLDVSKESFTGGLNVTDPNYNYSGNSLTYFAKNTTNDKPTSGYKNNIVSTGLGTKFEQYKDIYLSPALSFSYDDLQVQSTASDSLKKQKGTFSDLSFSYGITADRRDRVYAPTEGHIISFSQQVPVYADSPYLDNTFTFSTYKTFSPNAVGIFKFFAAGINGLDDKDVRLSQRKYIPQNRLRGFKAGNMGPKDGDDYVGGNYALATNFEMSLPNLLPESTKTDVGLFLDLGNLFEADYDSSIDDSNAVRASTGITTQWLSPVGPMSFVLSQNISKASTDQTERFSFRLGTSF